MGICINQFSKMQCQYVIDSRIYHFIYTFFSVEFSNNKCVFWRYSRSIDWKIKLKRKQQEIWYCFWQDDRNYTDTNLMFRMFKFSNVTETHWINWLEILPKRYDPSWSWRSLSNGRREKQFALYSYFIQTFYIYYVSSYSKLAMECIAIRHMVKMPDHDDAGIDL